LRTARAGTVGKDVAAFGHATDLGIGGAGGKRRRPAPLRRRKHDTLGNAKALR
jgi:hypothetical protein